MIKLIFTFNLIEPKKVRAPQKMVYQVKLSNCTTRLTQVSSTSKDKNYPIDFIETILVSTLTLGYILSLTKTPTGAN